jgi:flagellar protein FlaG
MNNCKLAGVTDMHIERIVYNTEPNSWINTAAQDVASKISSQKYQNSDTSVTGVAKSAESEESKKTSDNEKEQENKNEPSINDITNLKFQIHKETGEVMIKIIDSESGDVIREIPPEAILDSIAQIWKNSGIKVDERA